MPIGVANQISSTLCLLTQRDSLMKWSKTVYQSLLQKSRATMIFRPISGDMVPSCEYCRQKVLEAKTMFCRIYNYNRVFYSGNVKIKDDGIYIRVCFLPKTTIGYSQIASFTQYTDESFKGFFGYVGVLYKNKRGDQNFIHLASINSKKFFDGVEKHNIPIVVAEKPSDNDFPPNLRRYGAEL
jgi:hypothetical protein